ncbi:MAG: glutathione peroxidase [Myxococcota bacterium]|nr:glutathione peroxidase [Myxococcota bacterium]
MLSAPRPLLIIASTVFVLLLAFGTTAETPPESLGEQAKRPIDKNFHDFSANSIDGEPVALSAYSGTVVLVVNVATNCGYTSQYAGLQLYEEMKGEGLVVLGFPANDFKGQEPGSDEEIKAFCSDRYEVTFPMFSKISVKPGAAQHPLYTWLTSLGGEVSWNFNKFLIDREGKLLARFESRVTPESEELRTAIKDALGE